MSKIKSIILILAFFGGSAVMAMEVIFPRISVIWFGNLLNVWSATLIAALMSLSIGYYLGNILVKKMKNLRLVLVGCYALSAIIFVSLPGWTPVFGAFLGMGEGIGSLLCALLVMLPSLGVLAINSPILVHLVRNSTSSGGNAPWVFGISTLAGALMVLIGGNYVMMDLGISSLCLVTAILLALNAFLSFLIPGGNSQPEATK